MSNSIAIAGNIGVGKTTLTRLLFERYGWKTYYEPQAANPYILDFYRDMQRWSFHSQVFFLTRRFQDHIAIQQSKEVCIQDRSIYEDAEIFAHNLFMRKQMPQRDYETYQNLYEAMAASIKRPGLVVYLKANTWTLMTRIQKRGRDYERSVDREYLGQLNILYGRWIKKISHDWNLLVVDTDNFDMHENTDWLEEVLEEIGKRVSLLN